MTVGYIYAMFWMVIGMWNDLFMWINASMIHDMKYKCDLWQEIQVWYTCYEFQVWHGMSTKYDMTRISSMICIVARTLMYKYNDACCIGHKRAINWLF